MLSNTLFLKWELRRQFGVKVKNHSFNFIHSNFIYWEFKLKKTFLEGYNSSWISQISACLEQRLCLLFWTVFWRMSMHLPALIRRDSVFLWSKMQVCLYSCETEIMSICEAEGAIGLLLCIKDSDSLSSEFLSCDANPLWVLHASNLAASFASTELGEEGNWHKHTAQIICSAVSNKGLCLCLVTAFLKVANILDNKLVKPSSFTVLDNHKCHLLPLFLLFRK